MSGEYRKKDKWFCRYVGYGYTRMVLQRNGKEFICDVCFWPKINWHTQAVMTIRYLAVKARAEEHIPF